MRRAALPSILLIAGCSAFPVHPASSKVLLAFQHYPPNSIQRCQTRSQTYRSGAGIPADAQGWPTKSGEIRRDLVCHRPSRLLLRGGMGVLGATCQLGDAENGQAEALSRDDRRREHSNQVKEKLVAIAAGEKGLGKVRQHVNPLKSQFQVPTEAPEWAKVFADPSLPMHLDIGCGKGRFLLELAAIKPELNHYGVEIREPLVVRANKWAQDSELPNCFFSFANMNASIRSILKGYPGKISLVTILMPDPWFKTRHHKRRVVQPEFIDALAEHIPLGGRLIIGSDVHDVYQDIVWVLGNTTTFAEVPGGSEEWPLERQTERQISVQGRGEALYHSVYVRVEVAQN